MPNPSYSYLYNDLRELAEAEMFQNSTPPSSSDGKIMANSFTIGECKNEISAVD